MTAPKSDKIPKHRLSAEEQREALRLIAEGKPLPDAYRFLLFKDQSQVELVWNGKTNETCQVALPFQTIEQVDEPRTNQTKPQAGVFTPAGRQIKGWTNKLIWGDNKYILASLERGPLRHEIEKQGGLKLIYIDPPFDVGADFSTSVSVGEGEKYEKQPNVLEQFAYRDTWGEGHNSYLAMIYERLLIMYNLLADDGSIYVHCDYRLSAPIRLVLDEVFGKGNFRNEIVWAYHGAGTSFAKQFNRKHDTILWYSKSSTGHTFNKYDVTIPYHETTRGKFKSKGTGFGQKDEIELKEGKIPEDWWVLPIVARNRNEILHYPTQKPEKLLERIIKASSNEGDLVADFFMGSGTTAAVCEKLGRKWIGSDLGKFAIHTTRKRLINVQRQLKQDNNDYRPFEILNIGKYQREYYLYDGRIERDEAKTEERRKKEKDFIELILRAYEARPLEAFTTLQGKKGSQYVSIGQVNAAVSRSHVEETIQECKQNRIIQVDILGFEYEAGLFPTIREEAKESGVDIDFKYIPQQVFDKSLVERGEVQFYEVAYIDFKTRIQGDKLVVELTDFTPFYNFNDRDKEEKQLREGNSKIIVSYGKVVRIDKDEIGIISNEVLTKKWEDWVDYWSVDFDFGDRKEIIRKKNDKDEWEEEWTGDYIFDNEWQEFRTKDNNKLELKTSPRTIEGDRTKVAVKVVDIFGNDTMKVLEVRMR